MSKKSNNVPVFDLNKPFGGPQKPITINNNQPVYSSYTGELVGYGNVPKGTICDAPPNNPAHGKPFHVIEKYDSVDGPHYMIHRMKGNK